MCSIFQVKQWVKQCVTLKGYSVKYFLTEKRISSYISPSPAGSWNFFAVSPTSSHSPIVVIMSLEYFNISSADDVWPICTAVTEIKI